MNRLNKGILYRFYWKEEKSSKEIAKLFETTHSTILKYLKKYRIKIRPKGRRTKFIFSKNIIYDLYWRERLSAIKIAKMFGCSASCIHNFMKRNKIPRRRCGTLSKIKITRERLYHLYWKENKSTVDIAKILGTTRKTVFYHLKKYKIPLRKRLEAVSIGAHKKIMVHNRRSFSNDSNEKHYILGISEDFSVSKESKWMIKVSLSTSRFAMINIFYKLFSKFGPIWKYPVKDKVGNYHWRLVTTLDSSFHFLLKYKKHYNTETISKEEFFSFLSGLIDAEGSIVLSKNGKYISRAIVIGSENYELLRKVYKKLRKLKFYPHLYKRKEKLQNSKIGNLEIRYNNPLWILMVTNKKSILKLSQKLSLRHEEKINKLSLMIETLSVKHWKEIETKIEDLRNKIYIETEQMKEKARIALNHSSQNFSDSPCIREH